MPELSCDPALLTYHLTFLQHYSFGMIDHADNEATYQDYYKAWENRLNHIFATFYPFSLL